MNKQFSPHRRISPHFRLAEFTKSATAERHQLYNIPREESELANLRALAREVLEPVRALLGVPLLVTSGYRCATLNRLIGGAAQSQHMLGEAADFVPKNTDVEEAALLISAQPHIPFDQFIYEIRMRASAPPHRWIHISHKRFGENRREALTIFRNSEEVTTRKGVLPLSHFVSEANQT